MASKKHPGAAKGHRGWGAIRNMPSGRLQASYIGPDKRRHTAPTTFSVRTVAEGWLATERKLIESGDWLSPAARAKQQENAGRTLAEYADPWLEHRNIKERTRVHYRALLDAHIKPDLGQVPLRQLTAAHVRAWYATTTLGKPTLRSHAYGLLHAICATALEDGDILANPCRIKGAGSTTSKRVPVLLSAAEMGQLADAIDERYRALVQISAWCGLRWGEVTELRRKDVGAGAEVIHVHRGVVHREGCRVDTPKSGRKRTVVVPPHIRADIKAHLDAYTASGPEALLFAADRSCHLSDKTFRRYFKTALAAVRRDGVRIHDLRHFAGTQATLAGATLAETMDRLGHSTVTASLRYQQIVSGRNAEVAEALSRLAEGWVSHIALADLRGRAR